MAEPHETRQAHEDARRIRHDAERRARDMVEDARKEAQGLLVEARTAADAVLEDAKRLAEALRTTGVALSAQADALLRDVQLAHRELLGELRLPGVSERDRAARSRGPAPRPRPEAEEIFEPPDWIGGP
jgi:cell division septum initiation protein DivIVA